jgi:hypothetical protein
MVAQLVWVAYRFVIVGSAVLGAWAVVLFIPFETHAVVLDMPRGSGEVAATIGAFAPVTAAVVSGLLLIGINQLILLGVRGAVNRIWSRKDSTNAR